LQSFDSNAITTQTRFLKTFLAIMALDTDVDDMEAIQAQIDLAMSYTQELVSSWLKPSTKSSASTSHKDPEKELQEYMRRPPRCVLFYQYAYDVFTQAPFGTGWV